MASRIRFAHPGYDAALPACAMTRPRLCRRGSKKRILQRDCQAAAPVWVLVDGAGKVGLISELEHLFHHDDDQVDGRCSEMTLGQSSTPLSCCSQCASGLYAMRNSLSRTASGAWATRSIDSAKW